MIDNKKFELLHFFQIRDVFFLYDGNTNNYFKLSNKDFEYLITAKENENIDLFNLISHTLSKKKNIHNFIENFCTITKEKKIIRSIFINLTDMCNLKCVYCWNNQGDYNKIYYGNSFLENQNLEKIIGFINHYANEKLDVILYGGEPLLNIGYAQEIIVRLTNGIKNNIHILINTNGTTITETFCKIIKKLKVSLSFSLDGDKNYHNRNRPFADNKGSFDLVMRNIDIAQKYSIPFSIKATLYPGDYNFIPTAKYFLSKDLSNFTITKSEKIENYKESFLDYLLFLYDYYKKTGIIAYDLSKQLQRNYFYNGQLNCGAANTIIGFDVNGNIFPCMVFCGQKEYEIKLENYLTAHKELQKMGDQFSELISTKCEECWLKNKCYLGCLAKNHYNSGNILEPTTLDCSFSMAETEAIVFLVSKLESNDKEKLLSKLTNKTTEVL